MRKGYIESNKPKENKKVVNKKIIDNKVINNTEINVDNPKEGNKKHVIKFVIYLLICIFIYYQVFMLVSYTLGNKNKDDMLLYNVVDNIVRKIMPSDEKLIETTETHTLSLLALGDMYTSSDILKSFNKSGKYDFLSSFVYSKQIINNYDVTLASLNTPVAGSSVGLSNKTLYNAPIEFLKFIKDLGITAVVSAGNRSFDKGENGIKTTIKNINEVGLNQVGLNNSSERTKPYIIDKNNIKIAILSYTIESNVKLKKEQEKVINLLNEKNIKEDIDYIKSKEVDYIICYLSMPNVDATRVNGEQKNSVELLFDSGVDIVLGTGSKVVQDKYEDLFNLKSGENKHVYALYSLGDFIGDLNTEDRRISIGADIKFSKKIHKDQNGNILEDKIRKNIKINEPVTFYTKVDNNKIINYPAKHILSLYDKNEIKLDNKDYEKLKSLNGDANEE